MSRILMTGLAAFALVACAAAARPEASAQALSSGAPVSCAIRTSPTANGLLLEARAIAREAVDAEYQFTISKHGPSGSSDIQQGGAFSSNGPRAATVGSAEVSDERGDHFRAVLVVRDGDGQICREERRG